jgi:hypothetical protein
MTSLTAHFVVLPEHLPRMKNLESADLDDHWPLFNAGPDCWGLLTYLLLKQAGFDVSASHEARDGVVNVVFATLARAFRVPPKSWTLIVRADYRALYMADEHIVQNCSQIDSRSTWIALWPQMGLIPRCPERQGCKKVAFFGLAYYLAGSVDEWNRRLADLGMSFEVRSREKWNNYSDVDAVIAIRTFDDYPYPRKPPSKLVNAWFAGVPAICGADSAYQQIAKPDVEYLMATDMDSAIEQLRRLDRDPDLYRSLVEIGLKRCQEFSRARLIERWREVLEAAEVKRSSECYRIGRSVRWAAKNTVQGLYAAASELRRKLLGDSKLSR